MLQITFYFMLYRFVDTYCRIGALYMYKKMFNISCQIADFILLTKYIYTNK